MIDWKYHLALLPVYVAVIGAAVLFPVTIALMIYENPLLGVWIGLGALKQHSR